MKVDSVLGEWYDENCFVVSDEDHALVIDPGAKLELVMPFLQNKVVDGILLTHGHFDHALYLCDFLRKFGDKAYAGANAAKTLADHTLNQAEEWQIDVPLKVLQGDGVTKIGNFEVQFFETPGHSPCGMCYKIGENLFAGDTLFYSGIGRLDLVGSDKADMIKSLEKLSSIQFKNLYSGHGQSSDYARQKRNIAAYARFLKR